MGVIAGIRCNVACLGKFQIVDFFIEEENNRELKRSVLRAFCLEVKCFDEELEARDVSCV